MLVPVGFCRVFPCAFQDSPGALVQCHSVFVLCTTGTMSMKFLFVRHAQSANNEKSKVEGEEKQRDPDPPITEFGLRQSQCLAEYLKAQRNDPKRPLCITQVITSAMRRSLETVGPVCEALGVLQCMSAHSNPVSETQLRPTVALEPEG